MHFRFAIVFCFPFFISCELEPAVMCFQTEAETTEKIEMLRKLARTLSKRISGELVDKSDDSGDRTKLNIRINLDKAQMTVQDFGTESPTPLLCYDGSPSDEDVHVVISESIDLLAKEGFRLSLASSNGISSLPAATQHKITAATE